MTYAVNYIDCTKEKYQSKEIGTRLVYDLQQQKWILYISDANKRYHHLLELKIDFGM